MASQEDVPGALLRAAEDLWRAAPALAAIARMRLGPNGAPQVLLDGHPGWPGDDVWAALRQAEAALPAAADGGAGDRDPPTRPASPGADGGAAAADPPVSAAAADSSMVVDLLDDDDDGDGGAAASSAAAVPVDPTGLLTWMRDGKIAKKRAMLQRNKSPPRRFEEDPEIKERKRRRREEAAAEAARQAEEARAQNDAWRARMRGPVPGGGGGGGSSSSAHDGQPGGVPAATPAAAAPLPPSSTSTSAAALLSSPPRSARGAAAAGGGGSSAPGSVRGGSAAPSPARGGGGGGKVAGASAAAAAAGGAYGRGAAVPARWDESVMLGNLGARAMLPPPVPSAAAAAPPVADPYFTKLWPAHLRRRAYALRMPGPKARAAGDFVLLLMTAPLPPPPPPPQQHGASNSSNLALQMTLWLAEQMRAQQLQLQGQQRHAGAAPPAVPAVAVVALPPPVISALQGEPPDDAAGVAGSSSAGAAPSSSLQGALQLLAAGVHRAAAAEAAALAVRWRYTASWLAQRHGITLLAVPAPSNKQAAATLSQLALNAASLLQPAPASAFSASAVLTRAHAVVVDDSPLPHDAAVADELAHLLSLQPAHCPVWSVNSFAPVVPRVVRSAIQQRAQQPLPGASAATAAAPGCFLEALLSAPCAAHTNQAAAAATGPPSSTTTAATTDAEADFQLYCTVVAAKAAEYTVSPAAPLAVTAAGRVHPPSLALAATATSSGALLLVSPMDAHTASSSSSYSSCAASGYVAPTAGDAVVDYVRYRMFLSYSTARKVEADRLKRAAAGDGSGNTAAAAPAAAAVNTSFTSLPPSAAASPLKPGDASGWAATGASAASSSSSSAAATAAAPSSSPPDPDGEWLAAAVLPLPDVAAAAAAVLARATAHGAAAAGADAAVPGVAAILRGATGDTDLDAAVACLRAPAPATAGTTTAAAARARLALFSGRLLFWSAGLPVAAVARLLSDALLGGGGCDGGVHPSWLAAAAGAGGAGGSRQEAAWLAALAGVEWVRHH